MSTECHNILAYLSSINLIIFLVYVFSVQVISDQYVVYDLQTTNMIYGFCGLSSALLVWILLMYNKYIECNNRYMHVYKLMLLVCVVVLTYFGFNTIHVNEIKEANKDFVGDKEFTTYDYLLTKDNNDLMSILSILTGVMGTILVLCSY